eukprot:SAG22_NODE_19_length_32182_cov_39.206963_14_plen_191_part_00
MSTPWVLSLALFLWGAVAQMDPIAPPWNTTVCDLDALPDRIAELNTACARPEQTCDVGCAAVLFPIIDDCRPLLNELYDAADGTEDGEATIFSSAFARCNQIPLSDLLQFLTTLHDAGRCPDPALDGVGETVVKAAQCVDRFAAGAAGRCDMTISSGIFSCQNDFCNTVYPPCSLSGQCDATCGFCGDEI